MPNLPTILRVAALVLATGLTPPAVASLPGTGELTAHGDLAAQMVDGIHRFFEKETTAAARERAARFTPETGTLVDWQARAQPKASELNERLGLEPVAADARLEHGASAGEVGGRVVGNVSWPVLRGVRGEGLLIAGDDRCVVVLPGCETTPEQSFGLAPGLPPERQWANRLAADGATVLVVSQIDRRTGAVSPDGRKFRYSQREVLWRAAFELGRTMAGYEIQSALAAAAALRAERAGAVVRLVGSGDGGYLALLAGAVSTDWAGIAIEGAFASLDTLWEQPVDRTVFGLLRSFGLAEFASLVAPRPLAVFDGGWPHVRLTDEGGGAPGGLREPSTQEIREASALLTPERVRALWPSAAPDGSGGFSRHADGDTWLAEVVPAPGGATTPGRRFMPVAAKASDIPADESARQARQFRNLLDDTQHLMRQAQKARGEYWKKADISTAEKFAASAAAYREALWTDHVGKLPPATVTPNPRSRPLYDTPAFTGWEVMLDVYPDVFGYGILLLPKDLEPGERRPVVVCQHGLEGRPSDVADPALDHPAYHTYAARLAENGYIVFAPQNPYIGETRFRQLCQRAWPLGLSLWSIIVRQHETILDWLKTQPGVDPARIAFYGLSYGGKTAMRVPALLPDYCLSICSADYNEWIWKTVDAAAPYGYLHTVEYDMVEWNLGPTFNYAEMSWLIFPRPFMVERGHDDGVSCDEWVAYEFARTRRHYSKLGLADRTDIEFFNGPHTINGQGTFRFLDRWLKH
jgi:hypothetical protein